MGEVAQRKQEGKFKLDCVDKTKSRYKEYNPLFDKNLNPYFSTNVNKKTLTSGGFVTNDGYIIYDSVYRDTLGSIPKRKKGEKVKPEELMDTINEIKVSEDLGSKEKDAQEEALKKSAVLKTQLPAFKMKYPQFALYRTQKKKLPPKNLRIS